MDKSEINRTFDNSDDSDSDWDSDSDAQQKIMVKIKPISEANRVDFSPSPDVLNQISKNLKLKFPLSLNQENKSIKRRPNVLYSEDLSQVIGNESLSSIPSLVNQQRSTSPSSSSILSPRSESAISFTHPFEVDHNNNNNSNNISSYTMPQKSSTQSISISVFETSSILKNGNANSTAPPLPPLPPHLQLKVKEQQKKLQQQMNTDTHTQLRSEPILINTTIKLKKPVDIVYNEPIKNSIETTKPLSKTTSPRLLNKNFRINLKIPGEDEMQF